MADLKTYSIATSLSNGYNLPRLSTEISDSDYILGFDGILVDGDSLIVCGTSIGSEAGLNNVIAAHQVQTLAELKQSRYNAIDYKTGALVAAGFTFDSVQFSLSACAQMNWTTLKNAESYFTWPVEISTIDNNVYSLTQANLAGFWDAGIVAMKGHLDTGRALKKSIFDAADAAAVNAVIDNR